MGFAFSELWIATGIFLISCIAYTFLYAKIYPNAEFGAIKGAFDIISIFLCQDATMVELAK